MKTIVIEGDASEKLKVDAARAGLTMSVYASKLIMGIKIDWKVGEQKLKEDLEGCKKHEEGQKLAINNLLQRIEELKAKLEKKK